MTDTIPERIDPRLLKIIKTIGVLLFLLTLCIIIFVLVSTLSSFHLNPDLDMMSWIVFILFIALATY